MKRWYAAYTQPRSEFKAALHLRNQGFETYLPIEFKRRSHARRVDAVLAPFFSRYLFVAMDMACARWRAVNSTVGVVGLVRAGSDPMPVPDHVIEVLKAREREDGTILVDEPGLTVGAKLRLTTGPLAETVGLFQFGDAVRVTVLLDLMGRALRISVPRSAVTAA